MWGEKDQSKQTKSSVQTNKTISTLIHRESAMQNNFSQRSCLFTSQLKMRAETSDPTQPKYQDDRKASHHATSIYG